MNNDERAERQLWAAYRLILSWPKRDVQQNAIPNTDKRNDKTVIETGAIATQRRYIVETATPM